MILGNLYRGKGQVSRAISVHQGLLQRPDLTRLEHAYVLLCLGLDFRHAGFVDRALDAFRQVTELDPLNRYALVNMQKLHEEQHQWVDALQVRERIARLDDSRATGNQTIAGFLRNEIGQAQWRSGDLTAAARTFVEALDTEPQTAPALLNLGDIREQEGQTAAAIEAWERLTRESPDRAYLVFERLERAYAAMGAPRKFADLCMQLIAINPQDWRARLALSRHYARAGRHADALELLLAALPHNPHGLMIHQEAWHALVALGLDTAVVQRYVTLARNTVFYLDPHVCVRCRYRSTELLWQCPQCHEWNTFIEERIAPAKDVMADVEV
jgi:lipopolysaccharide biosynthesis regulator YciM